MLRASSSWCTWVTIAWSSTLLCLAMAQHSLESNPAPSERVDHLHRIEDNYVLHLLETHKLSRLPPARRIAVCMIGTRFDIMRMYDLYDHFNAMVIQPLGGKDAVDIFINADFSEMQSPAVAELKDRFTVLSVQALADPAMESAGAAACPSGTIRYVDDDLPCKHVAGAKHRCSAMQFFRLEACLDEIQKHEHASSFKYDWIARVRPDTFYESPIISSKAVLINETSILVPGADLKWGVSDLNALVPRQSAADYFRVAESVRACVNVTNWDALAADSKTFYPENIIAFHLRSLGYHFGTLESARAFSAMGHFYSGTIQGRTALPDVVRICGCPPDQMRSGLPPKTVCGEDLAKKC